MKKMLLLFGLILLVIPAAGYDFDLGDAGSVTVDVPSGWGQPTETRPEAGVVQFRISSPTEGNAAVIGTMIVGTRFMAPVGRIKSDFELSCSPYLIRSVEDTLDVRELGNAGGAVGFYTTLTDVNLVDAPGGGSTTKTSTRCLIVLSDSVKALVTIYCDDAESAVFEQALAIAQSFRHIR